ncbi:MAG: IclR family transcriptional regulator [Acidimicrobiales bacterium]|nr:IclR family transcriptional regulator [Acidimicrobiales bacterium]
MDSVSGVGVLDKAMAVLGALEAEPATLAELLERTQLPRATAHRLAVALEVHGLVRRDEDRRFGLGLRLIGLGRDAATSMPVWAAARPALVWLHEQTGESVQLFVRDGDARVCVESIESVRELRTIVPVGARLPLGAGSAGRILGGDAGRAWVQSVGEREEGVASVSAPIHDRAGSVVAAVSVSGPLQRTTVRPGAKYGEQVVEAARQIEAAIS